MDSSRKKEWKALLVVSVGKFFSSNMNLSINKNIEDKQLNMYK